LTFAVAVFPVIVSVSVQSRLAVDVTVLATPETESVAVEVDPFEIDHVPAASSVSDHAKV
jgi:hypothetical protein